MMTFEQFSGRPKEIPAGVSWYLADLGEARGKQELFTRQAPQRLKVLREHALIESAVSSNRIEGVTVEKSRIKTLVLGRPLLRDRDEEEVRGYRDALQRIHAQGARLLVSERPSGNCIGWLEAKSGMPANTRKRIPISSSASPMAASRFVSERYPRHIPRKRCRNSWRAGKIA